MGLAGESAGKAMGRIYGNIGFKGLWNGLPVRIFMIGMPNCLRDGFRRPGHQANLPHRNPDSLPMVDL